MSTDGRSTPGRYRPVDLEGFDFTVTGGVGTLVLDRTEKRNALSRAMWRALPEIIAGVDADDTIAALIITGAVTVALTLVGLAGVHRGRLNQYDDAHFQSRRELKRNNMCRRRRRVRS